MKLCSWSGAAVLGLAACSFPDVTFDDSNTGSGAGGSATVSSATGASSSTSATSTTSTSGGQGGGGGPDCDLNNNGVASAECGGEDCDDDDDGHASDKGSCGGDDCDDLNENAYTGQTAYFSVPRSNGSFDYNCSATPELQYGTVCEGPPLCSGKAFKVATPCGQVGQLQDCELALVGGLCQAKPNPNDATQACH